MELLQPYFAAPDFNYESARKASGNVAGLCNWAEAMCTYHEVAKVVEPKIAKLREAESELKVWEGRERGWACGGILEGQWRGWGRRERWERGRRPMRG